MDDREEPSVSKDATKAHHSTHFGDTDFNTVEEYGDATWAEVCNACCVHSPQEWGMILLGLFTVITLLYFFLFGLELLGTGAKVMSGCKAGELFGDDTNPIAGLMVGILSTVLLQSSSTTTSIIVSLVGSAINVDRGSRESTLDWSNGRWRPARACFRGSHGPRYVQLHDSWNLASS